MFLFLGNKRSVRKRDVIGIFDADTATVSEITKKISLLGRQKENGRISGRRASEILRALHRERTLQNMLFAVFTFCTGRKNENELRNIG